MQLLNVLLSIHRVGCKVLEHSTHHMCMTGNIEKADIEHIEWICKQFAEMNRSDVFAYIDGKCVAKHYGAVDDH